MCNINIIKNRLGKKSRDVTECMNAITLMSFKTNNDAEGHYCENFKVTTSTEKQIFRGTHSMIVAHERFSTSGKIAEMSQPLEDENFILTHNGVFGGLGNKDESDSFIYLKKLEKEFAKTKDTKTAINNVNKETAGYYSIVLYNKKTKEHLYYKHNANMFMIKSKEWVLMSTSKENVEYMRRYFGLSEDIEEVKENILFDLNDDMTALGSLEYYVYPEVQRKIPLVTWDSDYYRETKRIHRTTNSRREELIEYMEEANITPLTLGTYADEVMVGVRDMSEVRGLERLFPNAFKDSKKKESKKKYLVILDKYECIKEMEDWGHKYAY
jgi:glucosamine 6-phosphate synthetase-like amidotransferase/phosphosugar isomerase protein